MPELNIKLIIDGKEASSTLTLTKEQLEEIISKTRTVPKIPPVSPETINSISTLKTKLNNLTKEFESVEVGSAKFKQLEGEIKNTQSELDKIHGKVKEPPQLSGIDRIGIAITGLNQGLELARKGFDILSKPLEAAGQFEQYETSLKVMLGSTEAAKARLAELVEFAKTTPFELPQVVQAANQLQAIGKYSEENLRMLGDLASASGKPMEQALSAYSKLMTGQKGVAIDMFRDLLISATDWAEATGAKIGANGELQASVEQMAEALPKILQKKGFDGMMQAQAETANGMISNFSDAIGQIETAIGNKLLPAEKALVGLGTQIVSTFIPAQTHLEKTNQTATEQRIKFDELSGTFEILKGKVNKTTDEQRLYKESIRALQDNYPNYLKNVNLEKDGYDKVKTALEEARKELEKYLETQLQAAIMKDKEDEYNELGKKRYEATKKQTEAERDLQKAQKDGSINNKQSYTSGAGNTGTAGFSGDVQSSKTLGEKLNESVNYHKAEVKKYDDKMSALQAEIKEITQKAIKSIAPDLETETKSGNSGNAAQKKDPFAEKKEKEIEDIKKKNNKILAEEMAAARERQQIQETLLFEKEYLIELENKIYDAKDQKELDRLKFERDLAEKRIQVYENEAEKKQNAEKKLFEESQKNRGKRFESESKAEKETHELYNESQKNRGGRHRENLEYDEQEKKAKQETAQANIEAGMQQYDAQKSLDEQMKDLARERIKAYIAEAIAAYLATIIPTSGPLAFFLLPMAGLAMSALLEELIPKFEQGGLVDGPEKVIKINEKGPEFVMNHEATKRNLSLLEAMNAGQDPVNVLEKAHATKMMIEGSRIRNNYMMNSQIDFTPMLSKFDNLERTLKEFAAKKTIAYIGDREFRKAVYKAQSYSDTAHI